MIITQTPLRISFFGGGTDYPDHFRAHGGATLGTTIDKYLYVTVNPLTEFFDHRIRVSYSKTELCRTVDEIEHPAVRECLRFLRIAGGVEIGVVSDLPARTGLGSSSCFTVGLLHALHAFKGEQAGRAQLAEEAVHVEQVLIRERVGVQDQHLCAKGGLLHLECGPGDTVRTTPLALPPARRTGLQDRLLLFYTGLQRHAHQVLEQQIERTRSGALTDRLQTLHGLVRQGLDLLYDAHDLAQFGELLHHGWELKRQFSESVSNALIDDAYARARQAGAVGGKLLGAGGGGFLLLYVEPYNQAAVRQALAGMREVHFQFENRGSHLAFYQV